MQSFLATALVFCGGFAIMVLEIFGALMLQAKFGSGFFLWVSQIGVVMAALALGYYFGGWFADRFPRPSHLAWLLIVAGLFTIFMAGYGPWLPGFGLALCERIVDRHPRGEEISLLWQRLDPALGSAVLFLVPCFVLAMLSPFTIRLSARQLEHVGSASGRVAAASTVGSIFGVFVSGYVLISFLDVDHAICLTGALTIGLGALCFVMNRFYAKRD
jgi:MFS family permease